MPDSSRLRAIGATLVLVPLMAAAAPERIDVELRITDVTVFSDRARVTRSARPRLGKGLRRIVLPRLPTTVDPGRGRVKVTTGSLVSGTDKTVNSRITCRVFPALSVAEKLNGIFPFCAITRLLKC